MKCLCGARLELTKYDRDHQDGFGAKLLYECSCEECEVGTREVVRGHKPKPKLSREQLVKNYWRHIDEVQP